MEPDDVQEPFACPRCGAATTGARFYGPCPSCRAQLVAHLAGEARAVDAGRFEPALHVVPNQVATKE
jgi:hypothetical protein